MSLAQLQVLTDDTQRVILCPSKQGLTPHDMSSAFLINGWSLRYVIELELKPGTVQSTCQQVLINCT